MTPKQPDTFIENICKNFYYSFFIPIYAYQKDRLLFCYPEQSSFTHPPKKYLDLLLGTAKNVCFTETSFFAYFGNVKLLNRTDLSLIIGPVTNIPYSKDAWHSLLNDYRENCMESLSDNESFQNFFHCISIQSRDNFLHTLLFLNNCVNQTIVPFEELASPINFHQNIQKQFVQKLDEDTNSPYNNNNYSVEMELSHIIETGNLKELDCFVDYAQNVQVGVIANNNLRQIKNTFIFNTALAMHAAIRGGLSPDSVYQLSSVYCMEMERLQDPSAIRKLTLEMQKDFTERVARSMRLKSEKDVLQNAINYIRSKTHSPITTSDVAKYVGYSRSYLSRLFHKELPFGMKEFILRCKLEESRNLLLFSSYNIGEISNILCFSNQSHFHKCFKKQYGMTPRVYRTTAKKI